MVNRTLLIVLGGLLVMWVAGQAILVVMAGALMGVFLHVLASQLMRRTRLARGWSLTIVVAILGTMTFVLARLMAPEIAVQLDQLAILIPAVVNEFANQLDRYQWSDFVLADWQQAIEGVTRELISVFGHLTGIATATLQIIGTLVVATFIGLYAAAEPNTYRRGIVLLFPLERRERIDQVLVELAETLGRWLFARVVSMIFAGVLTWIGLVVGDIPLALTLALIATLLTFVPYLGPIIAAVPAIIIGFGEGWAEAIYVVVLYTAVQTLEGYIITPLLVRRTIAMPPAVTLAAQIIMGVVFGFMGIALAMPLTVVAMVLIQKLYIEDYPGDEPITRPQRTRMRDRLKLLRQARKIRRNRRSREIAGRAGAARDPEPRPAGAAPSPGDHSRAGEQKPGIGPDGPVPSTRDSRPSGVARRRDSSGHRDD